MLLSRSSKATMFRAKQGASSSRFLVNQLSGRTEPFNENVAQVKRLINRDRKEFMGNSDDILDKYTTEFGDGDASASTPDAINPFTSSKGSSPLPSVSSAPLPLSKSTDNPFKVSAASSNPFGAPAAAAPKPFKQSIEPRGLTPEMSPDPIIKETPISILNSIGLTQIVIFLSFSLIIGLMVATFFVVVNAGGIRLAGLE